MNKICFFIGVFITLLLAGCSSNPISHVRVATFNIRYDNPGDSLNSWKYRKEKVCEITDCELKQISGNNKDYIYKGNYHTQ